jgi:hypothetical protein
MEELVGSIQDPQIKDYMTESLSCYMAGAYRASVVLTFIALFDDILAKLGELGKVNKKARNVHENAKQKRLDQEVFETYLIDQLKANALLSSLDTAFLETLRVLRNKSAHPSGHHASAEEARFVFYEAVTRFLSKPILSTTQLADEVLAGLGNSNLFPSTNITVVAKVTTKELQNIHHETYPYLISKLLEKTQGAIDTTSKNALFFLNGLARDAEPAVLAALRKYVIEKTAANDAYQNVIISLLSANGKLFQDLDEVTYGRLSTLIADQIESTELTLEHQRFVHPASFFVALFAANDGVFILGKLSEQFEAFLERFPYSAYFNSKCLPFSTARKLLLARLNKNAASSDFNTANAFVRHLGDIEKLMADGLTPEEAFRLLISVLRAANVGAFASIDTRNAHFGAAPKLRARAAEFLVADHSNATLIAIEILGIPGADVAQELEYLNPVATA